MSHIDMHTLQTFANGRCLGLTIDGGRYDQGRDKLDLTRRYIFDKGAIALVEADGTIIVGPVNFADATELAGEIVEANARALTTPTALTTLAATLLAASCVGIETPSQTAPSAIGDVIAERRRQVDEEGFTAAHDDQSQLHALVRAAAAYAVNTFYPMNKPSWWWPWDIQWWKPKDERRDLVRAAALIVARIEQIDRLEGSKS